MAISKEKLLDSYRKLEKAFKPQSAKSDISLGYFHAIQDLIDDVENGFYDE